MNSPITELSVEEVKTRLDSQEDILLVDVREDDEWATGHLPKAIHIARAYLPDEFAGHCPNKDKTIIAYCARGRRSLMAAETLVNMGYTHVISMAGGIVAWNEKGLPIE